MLPKAAESSLSLRVWTNVEVSIGDTGYAGLELLPDGTFVSTTYVPLAYGAKPSVVSLRFTLDELDALVDEESGLRQRSGT